MTRQVIPIRKESTSLELPIPSLDVSSQNWMDQFGRPLHDLRISVTDRCNFRCIYCMPKDVFNSDYPYLQRSEVLSFEEIVRVAKIFVAQGGKKIRLTGGEPLLRKNLEKLIQDLANLRTSLNQNLDLSLTTNGILLPKMAKTLKRAGLNRVTVSLDAIEQIRFEQMSDTTFQVQEILQGIDVAVAEGLGPVKVNMVVKAGVNEDQIIPMIDYFRGKNVTLRFIEFMDVGNTNEWSNESVLPSHEILRRITAAGHALIELPPEHRGETATRWKFSDGSGEIGFVSSISHAFCADCTRARLSTDGKIFNCLFASNGYDLRSLLRDPQISEEQLYAFFARIWQTRADRYSAQRQELLAKGLSKKKIEMSYIGG